MTFGKRLRWVPEEKKPTLGEPARKPAFRLVHLITFVDLAKVLLLRTVLPVLPVFVVVVCRLGWGWIWTDFLLSSFVSDRNPFSIKDHDAQKG